MQRSASMLQRAKERKKAMTPRYRYPCTFQKACFVLWAVRDMGWSQTQAAIEIGLYVGTVCHVVHRRRFPSAYPMPMPMPDF